MQRRSTIFLAISMAQLAVPAWMIFAHERVIFQGEVFKFRTAPIDPRDPFRGEYVSLNFEASSGTWPDPHNAPNATLDQVFGSEEKSFALLAVNDSGFATVTKLLADEPPRGVYLKVTHWSATGSAVNQLALPFDRYYLKEGNGAKAESMMTTVWNGDVSQPLPTYALVRVYEGEAVIEDLIIGGRSIDDRLNEP